MVDRACRGDIEVVPVPCRARCQPGSKPVHVVTLGGYERAHRQSAATDSRKGDGFGPQRSLRCRQRPKPCSCHHPDLSTTVLLRADFRTTQSSPGGIQAPGRNLCCPKAQDGGLSSDCDAGFPRPEAGDPAPSGAGPSTQDFRFVPHRQRRAGSWAFVIEAGPPRIFVLGGHGVMSVGPQGASRLPVGPVDGQGECGMGSQPTPGR